MTMSQLSFSGLGHYENRAALVEQTRVLLRTHTEWPAIGNLRSQHRLDAEATAIINDLVALTDDDREEYA
mgnify:FL=1